MQVGISKGYCDHAMTMKKKVRPNQMWQGRDDAHSLIIIAQSMVLPYLIGSNFNIVTFNFLCPFVILTGYIIILLLSSNYITINLLLFENKIVENKIFFDLGAIVNVTLLCYSCPSSYITRAREFLRFDILV